jgi:hypothetical protein
MIEGFKIGGVNGHPVAHGASQVFHLAPINLILLEGVGVYTGIDPSGSLGYCIGSSYIQCTEYRIIALRCLPGKRRSLRDFYGCGEWQTYDSNDANGSVIVLKTPGQCLVKLMYSESFTDRE